MKTINELLLMTQTELFSYVANKCNIISDKYTIFSDNDKPKPLICVHLDTINTHHGEEKLLKLKEKKGIISVANKKEATCLGADDRAGVWIALQLMVSCPDKYDFAFFKDEEIGGVGSATYTNMLNTTCYIGLDRRSQAGRNEVATYGYDNQDLIDIFEKYDYLETMGSFTDASNIASNSNIACVNLSVGYDNEHTPEEVLHLSSMEYTLATLNAIEWDDTVFEQEESEYDYYDEHNMYGSDDWEKIEAYEEFIAMMGYEPDDVFFGYKSKMEGDYNGI